MTLKKEAIEPNIQAVAFFLEAKYRYKREHKTEQNSNI